MQFLEQVEALVPLFFPLGIGRSQCFFRQEVINSGQNEGSAGTAGRRCIVGKSARVVLDPLIQLICCLRRILDGIGIVSQNNGCSTVRHQIIRIGRLYCQIAVVAQLGCINLGEDIVTCLRQIGCSIIVRYFHNIIVSVCLTCLLGSDDSVTQRLGTSTGSDELQLGCVITLAGIELFNLLFKLHSDIVGAVCPDRNRLRAGSALGSSCGAAGCHGSSQ